ncbi:DNA polymerase nu-like isoform X3 [Mercenaria mercenaria]|uniref:DNA polymerase nu-like isoform X3 n=1 Tax=Mercenaria mercenaria TaxID=6596 RepID=UPI00234E64DF|nr:DNA polymerase nu-like isoform X3 [Mercenaria mercenaria]
MAAVWTPKEKPVVLDKFCHLSLDAQKVMASMYRDFHQRKAEIKASYTLHNAAFKDTRDYNEERSTLMEFSRRGRLQEQRSEKFQKQRYTASSPALSGERETGIVGHNINKKSSVPYFLSGASETDCADGQENRERRNTGSIADEENMDSLSPVRNNIKDCDECYAGDNIKSPPVETRDFEILSQYHLMDTQADLFSDSHNNVRNGATMSNQSKTNSGQDNSVNDTLNKGKGKEVRLPTTSFDYSHTHFNERLADSEHSGLKLLELNEESASYIRANQNQSGVMKPRQGSTAESTEDSTGMWGYDRDDRKIDKSYSCHIITNGVQSKQKELVRDKLLCEESPYLDRTPKVARKSFTVNDSSRDAPHKKKHKLIQTRIMFEKLGSETHKDEAKTGTFSGKKHFTGDEGSEIPTKKLKNCSLNTREPINNVAENITYISKLPVDTVDQVCSQLLQAEELVLCLVFANGSTQLRDNLFTAENKKKTTTKVKKHSEVDGIAIYSTAPRTDRVYVFSMQDRRSAVCEKLREFWGTLLSSDDVRKIGFQIKEVYLALFANFDFEYNRVDLSWTVMDTSIAVWLLDPDKPVSSFEHLLSVLNMPKQTPSKSCVDALQEDMTLLSAVMKKIYQMLQSKDMWNLFYCLETKLVNVLAGMERRRMTISIHTLLHFSSVLKRNLTRLEEKAHKVAGHAFLLNSHHQLRQVLFEELKLDSFLQGKTKLVKTSVTRETSTSETVLTQLLPFHPLPEVVLEYRQLQKLKSTYIDGILSCVSDSYLRTHWDQTAAATGRLTSHHPNIQAILKLPVTIKDHQTNFIVGKKFSEDSAASVVQFNARDPFISRPQWSLLSADFQQIELRLLGHLADDPILLNIFNDTNVPDIFNALAAQWLSKAATDVTDADREQTKRVVYSVMYGVGKEKLADYLKCTPDNAKAVMASFLLKFPAVNQFTKYCVEFCQKHGYTRTIFKRRRLFPNIRHGNPALRAQAERQCVNFCVQGLVKSVMESEEKLCGSIVKLKVPIPVSVSVGKKWGQMEFISVTCNNG